MSTSTGRPREGSTHSPQNTLYFSLLGKPIKPMRVHSTLQAVGIAALMLATADAALRRPAVQARQMMSTQDDYDCTPENCVMGGEFDCMCANTTAPGGIPANRVPMMVLLTWDDAVTGEAFDKTSAIANGIRSANNCPLRSTYYVSTGTVWRCFCSAEFRGVYGLRFVLRSCEPLPCETAYTGWIATDCAMISQSTPNLTRSTRCIPPDTKLLCTPSLTLRGTHRLTKSGKTKSSVAS